MMNCDHAFDLMTDPAGEYPAELLSHLDGCPRCRQMYETLSPALELFSSTTSAVSGPLTGTARATSVEMAERVAVRLQQPPTAALSPQAPRRNRVVWTCLLAGGLGILSAIGWHSLQPGVPVQPQRGGCTWTHRDAIPSGQPAAEVVLSCVACHAATPQQPQTTRLPWEDWQPVLLEVELSEVPDDLMWLQWAVWPNEKSVHT